MAEKTTWHLEDDVLMPLADEVQRLWPDLKDEQFSFTLADEDKIRYDPHAVDFVTGPGLKSELVPFAGTLVTRMFQEKEEEEENDPEVDFRYRVYLNVRCKWSNDEGFNFIVGEGVGRSSPSYTRVRAELHKLLLTRYPDAEERPSLPSLSTVKRYVAALDGENPTTPARRRETNALAPSRHHKPRLVSAPGDGLASGLYNTARQVGQSVGIAVLGALAALDNSRLGFIAAVALITCCAVAIAATRLRK